MRSIFYAPAIWLDVIGDQFCVSGVCMVQECGQGTSRLPYADICCYFITVNNCISLYGNLNISRARANNFFVSCHWVLYMLT